MPRIDYSIELDELISRLGIDPDQMSRVAKSNALAYLTSLLESVRNEAFNEGREDHAAYPFG